MRMKIKPSRGNGRAANSDNDFRPSVPRNVSTGEVLIRRTSVGLRNQIGLTSAVTTTLTVPAATAYVPYNAIFQINDLPGYTDLTTLFTEYKFEEVVVHFRPLVTEYNIQVNQVGTVASVVAPTLFTAVDVDGAQSNATLAPMCQYGSLRMHDCTKPVDVRLRPAHFSSVQNSAAGGTTNSGRSNGWVALLSGSGGGSVDHYGLAFAVCLGGTNVSSVAFATHQFYVTYTVRLRHSF